MSKISTIIPVYNAEKYIKKCILSIANQTEKDIEIIAVNDGSTDRSREILDELSTLEECKGKLIIIDKANGGAGSARNVGLDAATGEFIKFIDADDFLFSTGILERMYQLAIDNDTPLVRGNYRTKIGPIYGSDKCSFSDIKESGVIDLSQNKNYIVTESPGIGNKLVHRSLFDGLRFPEGTKWEDFAVIPVVLARSGRIYHMEEPVYTYRIPLRTTIKDFVKPIPSILDIVKNGELMEQGMANSGLSEEFKDQIESLFVLHTLFRAENVITWFNFPRSNKKVIVSSLVAILDSKYPNWEENLIIDLYKKKNILFKFDMWRMPRYIDEFYREEKDREIQEIMIGCSFIKQR